MASFAMLGIEVSKCPSHIATPITTLCHILAVSELKHEFVAGLGILGHGEPPFLNAFAESIVGKGRGHDVECGS
jgi:hypothetical protein